MTSIFSGSHAQGRDVYSVLGEYAERGVFQQFQTVVERSGKTSFHFEWAFRQPYTMLWDAKKGLLVFQDFLPRMASDSLMYRELKAFIKSREDPHLPEHRRLDSERATVRTRLRQGVMSIEMTLGSFGDSAYGAGKLIQLVHEIFLFLGEYWVDYMWEHFQVNAE
jgi:hypothetical protein